MGVTLTAALLLQALEITLLRHRLGRRWLRHPVSIMILVSVAYQGISPISLALPSIGAWDSLPDRDRARLCRLGHTHHVREHVGVHHRLPPDPPGTRRAAHQP